MALTVRHNSCYFVYSYAQAKKQKISGRGENHNLNMRYPVKYDH